ncbi:MULTISPECIES: PD-(D/E)XK nuclease family transposase [unclassified Fibrobacter]|uniref:PD-(D/E)XK nuclease family transposase n=1 Tax=unclassified Fibrobacter TaxID=2634177 RepID=UPI000D6CA297|nr:MULTISPECIES: PD-(D/E)XK nuclease family transposase [unclassified Fibrobacter]PWJ59770.1 PD-(D/E)XK nuclease-like transposase [Fibrobacter sp. UWR4]PZW68036.1 PD-(D/E)XK nuclease-like transposase [Fibrobacter sp. UWR1]
MNKEEMNNFLVEVYDTHKANGDVNAVITKYEKQYKYVYFYNDMCAKHILTGNNDLSLVTDLANAALRLTGSDCISNPTLENPAIGGGLVHKDIEHDIFLNIPRKDADGKKLPGDRIGIEFQHVGYDVYNNRLLFYVARDVSNSLLKGDFYDKMPCVHLISFQMFDYKPWKTSQKYIHTVRYQDDEQSPFSDRQSITIVEVGKFLKHADTDFANDSSRIAQWLRAIDTLNSNGDYTPFASDAIFSRLQKYAEMSTFMPELFIEDGKNMRDTAEVLAYIARKEERNAKIIAEQGQTIAEQARKIAELEAKLAENCK